MKKAALVMLAFFSLNVSQGYVFCAEIPADSRISQVTIYPGSALVTRSAEVKLNAGDHQVIFRDIVPDIDENSLKVKGAGSAVVKILGAQVKKEFLQISPAENIHKLQEDIQKLADENKRLSNARQIIAEEKQYIDSIRLFSNQQIPKDLVTKAPAVGDLESTFKFIDSKLRENFNLAMETELAIRENQKKIDVLQRELAQISGQPSGKQRRSIIVDVETDKPGDLELNVSYLVSGASWSPIYDARADFEKSQVDLAFQAIIQQRTGENWQDVEVSLSTARPDVDGRIPYIAPWFVRPYQPREVFYDREEKADGLHQYASMKNTMAFSEGEAAGAAPAQKRMPAVSPQSQAEVKGLAVVYKLAKKANINSDGSDHRVAVSSQVLQGVFKYSTCPRLSPSVYLGTRVTNAKDIQLLAGRMNVFLDGDFVGISSIDNIGPQEEFDLYLGADENVKVKRQLLEKKTDDMLIGGIPSPNKKVTFKYKTILENYKNKKSAIYYYDAIPVPQSDRIKVKVEKVSLEPNKKDWEDRKGVWRWELELEPKAKQEIFLSYSVEFPRDLNVEGID